MACHHRHRDDDDHFDEDNWDKMDQVQRRNLRVTSRTKIILPIAIALVLILAAVYFIFSPPSDTTLAKVRTREEQNSLADRATAFKVLELMEYNRISEAITLAETLADRLSNAERDIATQITKTPDEIRTRLESFICQWIAIEHNNATQSTVTKRIGFPSASTPDAVILLLCDYADYRARTFAAAPREISDELLSRIFLLAADEKYRRAAGSRPQG